MFLAWWSVALPAAFASTCFTCCLQDGVTPQERKNLLNPAGESYPVGIWQGSWSYSAAFTALIKIGIEEKLGYNAVWQPGWKGMASMRWQVALTQSTSIHRPTPVTSARRAAGPRSRELR